MPEDCNCSNDKIDNLCEKCKKKKIMELLIYEKYRYDSCHGGC